MNHATRALLRRTALYPRLIISLIHSRARCKNKSAWARASRPRLACSVVALPPLGGRARFRFASRRGNFRTSPCYFIILISPLSLATWATLGMQSRGMAGPTHSESVRNGIDGRIHRRLVLGDDHGRFLFKSTVARKEFTALVFLFFTRNKSTMSYENS